MMKLPVCFRKCWIPGCAVLLILFLPQCKYQEASQNKYGHVKGTVASNAMVVSAHPRASEVGAAILRKGGNAIDAAIAVQFALAVVYPVAGNIGGGGFMVIRKKEGDVYSLDYREKAPKNASAGMYLDDDGEVIAELSTQGHLASGVPGTVDGMVKAHERFGSLPWLIY